MSKRFNVVSHDKELWQRLSLSHLGSQRFIASYDEMIGIDWKAEYIARKADICVHWLEDPCGKTNGPTPDVKSVSPCNYGQSLITAFGDGSIGIYNIPNYFQRAKTKTVSLAARSKPSTLHKEDSPYEIGTYTENISVDDFDHRTYVAWGSTVTGVDNVSLAQVSISKYIRPVTAMSSFRPRTSTTVATSSGLYLHDPRNRSDPRLVTDTISHGLPDILAILHRGSHTVHVAGRFPSIVTYDRRFMSRVHSTIWTGARTVQSLAEVPPSIQCPQGAILAAGACKGRKPAILELHPVDATSFTNDDIPSKYSPRIDLAAPISRSLLYAVPHGNRIVHSDVQGRLTWRERGRGTSSKVRHCEPAQPNSVQSATVRKIMLLGNDLHDPRADLALWDTDQAVCVAGFGARRFGEDFSEQEDHEGEIEATKYRDRMRKALQQNAEDIRFMTRLGLFSST